MSAVDTAPSSASAPRSASSFSKSPTSSPSNRPHRLYVKYNDDKNARITAIAACEIPFTEKKSPQDDGSGDHEMFLEKCAFTLEYLSDCDGIGILLQSETKSGTLEWRLVCRPDISFDPANPIDVGELAIHRFDITMLKKFIDIHGANFLKCPLCKQGSKKKKDVQEHDIDTMAQLKQKRDAQRKTDIQMCFFTEGLMLRKACEETPQHPGEYAKVAKEVLCHWEQNQMLESFGTNISQCLELAIKKDHHLVVQDMLTQAGGLWKTEDHEKFLEEACRYESINCMKHLMQSYDCPIGKYGNALREMVKHGNIELIDYLFEEMKKVKEKSDRVFILNDVFREAILKDMEGVARTIIENRWHRPNQSDLDLAKKLDGSVNIYLESRMAPRIEESYATCYDDVDCGDDQAVSWDDWGDGGDDDEFEFDDE